MSVHTIPLLHISVTLGTFIYISSFNGSVILQQEWIYLLCDINGGSVKYVEILGIQICLDIG